MYTHYLKSEAYRRALAYQKRYVLLLLGGFQQSEQEILMTLVRLGTPVNSVASASQNVRTCVGVPYGKW